MGFFFLNKNKPKGRLGIVVPTASLVSSAPEEHGCVKRLDHTSRRALGPSFPPSPSHSLLSSELGKKRGGETFGEGTRQNLAMCGNWLRPGGSWEALLGRGGGCPPTAAFNPF